MDASKGNFKYDTLQADEIRLVALNPGEFGSSIVRSIRHAKQAQNLRYYALSYVWGNRRVTKLIRLGAVVFPVTLNLDKALQHLRYPE